MFNRKYKRFIKRMKQRKDTCELQLKEWVPKIEDANDRAEAKNRLEGMIDELSCLIAMAEFDLMGSSNIIAYHESFRGLFK